MEVTKVATALIDVIRCLPQRIAGLDRCFEFLPTYHRALPQSFLECRHCPGIEPIPQRQATHGAIIGSWTEGLRARDHAAEEDSLKPLRQRLGARICELCTPAFAIASRTLSAPAAPLQTMARERLGIGHWRVALRVAGDISRTDREVNHTAGVASLRRL